MNKVSRQVARWRARHPRWQWPTGSVVIGETKSGNKVWISREDRGVHTFVAGQSGKGKSKLLESVIRQNILEMNGERRCTIVIDPHGPVVENTLRWVATHRLHDLRTIRVLDPSDPEHVFGMNPCRAREGVDPAVTAAAVLNAILTAGWRDEDASALPRLRQTGKAILYVLAALGLSFLEIDDLFDPEDRSGLRQYVIDTIRHPSIRRFFQMLGSLPPSKVEEVTGSFDRRMNECLLPAAMRRIFAARDRFVDFRAAMDGGDVVFVNIASGNGRISEDESTLLGCLIITDIFLSSLGRPEGSVPVDLIIDEAHRFLTEDVANILDQARKFSLSAMLATQHLGHLRDRGEHIYRSVMANTRTKIIFGGLDDDDATLMARNMYRGSFQLSRDKKRFRAPGVVGQDYDWLRSESVSHGMAHAVGTTETVSEGESVQHSKTESQGTSFTETATQSTSETLSESYGYSETHSDEVSGSSSQSDSTSGSSGRSKGSAQEYEYGSGVPVGGPTVSRGWSQAGGSGSTTSSGSGWGSADTIGSSYTSGNAITTGEAHSTSSTISQSTAETHGTTQSTQRSRGTTITDTVSEQRSVGRAQTLRSVFKTMPTTPFSLEELVHLASVSLANLPVGTAIVKVGTRRPVRINTLRIKDGWATPEHVARVKRRLAEAAPFITPLAEARAAYIAWRKALIARVQLQQLAPPSEQVIDLAEEEPVLVPVLKDEGWG